LRCLCALHLLLLILCTTTAVIAQSTDATISGLVLDPSGRVIPNADIEILNESTGVLYSGKTNETGIYTVSILPPGQYRLQVSKIGFKSLIKPGIVLNVQSAVALNFTLPLGATSETVTVGAGASQINTTDASVSTVIDRTFAENTPLNGRSFQDLISITPGIVTASPQGTQGAGSVGDSGDFSVNGQRTESNYYTVDGVSGNIGAGNGYGVAQAASGGGQAATTAFGTTQALVSVDALQEFRVLSSTYSAEYGHGPGGQFSILTRSGTNAFNGTAFDYMRNSFFDANDWFNDYYGKPEAPLRQNDFGGVIGGPVWIPKLYKGINKTFFFFSYEGLRITQPQAAAIQYVPDTFMRHQANPAVQPILNAFPLQNGLDYGTATSPSLAQFIEPYSVPGHIDSASVRLDHTFLPKLITFFRFANAESSTATRSLSVLTPLQMNTRTYTTGATSQFSPTLTNELRAGFSHSESTNTGVVDGFGGAQPVSLASVMGASIYPHASPDIILYIPNVGLPVLSTLSAENLQSQWNVNDSVSMTSGRHQMQLGIDYWWVRSPKTPASPSLVTEYTSAAQVLTNTAAIGEVEVSESAVPIFHQFAAYAQDEWHVTKSLNLSAGLRWELNPAPTAKDGNLPYTLRGSIGNPASLQLAPKGTSLWNTVKFNFAPRLGIVWTAHASSRWETVFRAGGGVYFDTANEAATQGYSGIGFRASSDASAFSLPFTTAQLAVTPSLSPPYTTAAAYAFPARMQLPYTLQWNSAIEQSLGRSQTFTLSYVGANGRRLVGEQELYLGLLNPNPNPNFAEVIYFANGITSNYQAFQLQFQRSVSRAIQALASYTWAHSIDFGSNDTSLPLERGNSDFDVRHNFQAGLSWDLPKPALDNFGKAILTDWGLDARVLMRTAFPITLDGSSEINTLTGNIYYSGLNYDGSKPLYLYGSEFPGRKAINGGANNVINPAFTLATGTNPVGNAPRNIARGFGLSQVNLAVRRQFAIHKETSVQFRAEAFNVFNRPNFGYVSPLIAAATFGQATTMLNGSLGTMAPQYQQGGARSMQFALRLRF
jgi:hypothetical protein